MVGELEVLSLPFPGSKYHKEETTENKAPGLIPNTAIPLKGGNWMYLT